MALRVATYNIHRCIGRDGRESPRRIAEVLRALDADLIALQEVACCPGCPGDILQSLADATDTEPIAGPTLLEAAGYYGNALLTRIKPREIQRVDISVPGREPRGLIKVTLDAAAGSVAVLTTHLGLAIDERRLQMGRIVDLLEEAETESVILMGDFNEWLPWGRPLRRVLNHFATPRLPAPATFPSRRPFLALDRIWVRSARPIKTLRVFSDTPARMASDHLPLVADLDL